MQNKENINAKNSESQKHFDSWELALGVFAECGKLDSNLLKEFIILLTRSPLFFPIEIDMDAMFSGIDPTTLKAGDTFSPDQDVKIIIRTLMVPDDEQPEEIIPAFTSLEEANKGPQSSFMQMYPQEYLRTVSQMGKPVVINLFGKTLLHLRPKVFQEILPGLMNDSFGGKSEMETSRQCTKNADNDSNDTMDRSPYKTWKESNLYKNKQFSVLGDSISTLAGYNPRGYAVFYDGETCEKSSVKEMKDTWWGKVIDFFGGEPLVNNSWSGSRVTQLPLQEERLFPSGCSEERTNNLHVGELKPDVIIVYLGTNDWANNVPLWPERLSAYDMGRRLPVACVFAAAYNYMLLNLRNNYPNAEIWCCTLCETFMSNRPDFRFPHKYAGTHIEAYNDIIRKSASRNRCKLLDLYSYKIPYDSVDGTHPNFDGMNTLATMMIREIGGKEVEPFLDCAQNQHEFEIAEQYCDAVKYVCKKCGKSKIESARQCTKNADNDSNDTMDRSPYKTWKESNLYKNKQFSVLGDSISTLAGYNPRGYAVFYDGETCEKSSVKEMKDTWWGKVIDFFGGEPLVNNSWSGSRVTQLPLQEERLFPSGCSEERTNNLHVGELKPDVIIVYLGTNDWANNVPLWPERLSAYDMGRRLPVACVFAAAYNYMLLNLRNNYPNAEIWCCTLCETFMSNRPDFRFPHKYAGTHIEAYNDIIRKSASRNRCKLLDLYSYKIPYDSVDGTHPNFDGMNTLATMMIREIGGKEVEPFLDCAQNQHEFEIAEQYCDAVKYVCKKCGKSKIESARQCGNVDKDGVDAQRYCAQCGHVIHKNARFCTNCGKTVSNKSESASPKPAGVGTIIDGKYKLLKLIGQGGTFKVFLAMDVRLNKIWAVKILRDDYQNADYETQGMLRKIALHEATLLQDLNHPAIPNIVDIIDVPGFFATVQEYVEGETLNEIVKTRGAQPVDLVMDWAKQLCDVLAYLHALKPPHIHRDIKPNNLILTPNGRIKIIDFGIMRTYKPAQKNDTCSLGTKGYAAPEQYGGRGQTDARTDIYGVGMTLYHLLTEIDPGGENFVVRPLCQVNPALPKGIEYIIDKCIQLNPKDRYQNCTDLLNDLNHYTELPR